MIVIVVKPYVGFPNGTAATSRVTAYARGLAAAGEDVRVILLGPSEPDEARAVNLEVAGTFRGIPFEYTSVSPIKDPSLPVRRWRAVSSVLTAGRRIRELHACTGVDAVLLYSGSVRTGRYFARLCRSLGVTCALDLAEMPFHGLPPGARRDRRQQGYGRRLISRFDLVVAITRFLADYASPFLRDGAEAIVLPIMVDPEDFRPDAEQAADPRIVEYVGMLNERKDGVATLMTAFSRLAAEFPDTVLRLVGDSDDPRHSNVPEYQEKAARLGIEDRVDFTGQVRRDAIPGLLAESSVLVLARPRSQQADAGFPTKLGEYLASGRPVVITRTGDIGRYLTDGADSRLVPPDDVDALTGALRDVLAHPEAARALGEAGRRVALANFDYRAAGSMLSDALRRVGRARS